MKSRLAIPWQRSQVSGFYIAPDVILTLFSKSQPEREYICLLGVSTQRLLTNGQSIPYSTLNQLKNSKPFMKNYVKVIVNHDAIRKKI